MNGHDIKTSICSVVLLFVMCPLKFPQYDNPKWNPQWSWDHYKYRTSADGEPLPVGSSTWWWWVWHWFNMDTGSITTVVIFLAVKYKIILFQYAVVQNSSHCEKTPSWSSRRRPSWSSNTREWTNVVGIILKDK